MRVLVASFVAAVLAVSMELSAATAGVSCESLTSMRLPQGRVTFAA